MFFHRHGVSYFLGRVRPLQHLFVTSSNLGEKVHYLHFRDPNMSDPLKNFLSFELPELHRILEDILLHVEKEDLLKKVYLLIHEQSIAPKFTQLTSRSDWYDHLPELTEAEKIVREEVPKLYRLVHQMNSSVGELMRLRNESFLYGGVGTDIDRNMEQLLSGLEKTYAASERLGSAIKQILTGLETEHALKEKILKQQHASLETFEHNLRSWLPDFG